MCFRRAIVALTALPGIMLTGVCLIAVVNCAVNMTTIVDLYELQKDFDTGLLGFTKIQFHDVPYWLNVELAN